jgi:predicted O-methyltransferase YrrM
MTMTSHAANGELARITSHPDPRVKAIGEALLAAMARVFSPEERHWIGLIEQRRAQLLASSQVIPVIDYGAGRPDSRRSREEMEQGVPSSAEIRAICGASKPPFWASLLMKLIVGLKPSSCLELGSCVGISASYMGAALQGNRGGRLTSLEGSPEVARIARETLGSLGIGSVDVVTGPFHKTLAGVMQSAGPIDFFFNDGHHDHDAVLGYFDQALPHLADNSVMVLDDIGWSEGMRKAWASIAGDSRVRASIDLGAIGIVVINRKSTFAVRIS